MVYQALSANRWILFHRRFASNRQTIRMVCRRLPWWCLHSFPKDLCPVHLRASCQARPSCRHPLSYPARCRRSAGWCRRPRRDSHRRCETIAIDTVPEAAAGTRPTADMTTIQLSKLRPTTAHHQAPARPDGATTRHRTEARNQKVTEAIDSHHLPRHPLIPAMTGERLHSFSFCTLSWFPAFRCGLVCCGFILSLYLARFQKGPARKTIHNYSSSLSDHLPLKSKINKFSHDMKLWIHFHFSLWCFALQSSFAFSGAFSSFSVRTFFYFSAF